MVAPVAQSHQNLARESPGCRATAADVSGREVQITNKKGVFILDVDDLLVTYRYRFEKAGYRTLLSEQDWSLEGTKRVDFTMQLEGTSVEGDVSLESASSQSVRAYNGGVAAFEQHDFATAMAKFEQAVKPAAPVGITRERSRFPSRIFRSPAFRAILDV